jgi:hypothetical protein
MQAVFLIRVGVGVDMHPDPRPAVYFGAYPGFSISLH